MRAGLLLAMTIPTFGACAGGAAGNPAPDWRGPAVHCRHLGDRGLAIELVAPTAGHRFELASVEVRGEHADVVCRHQAPKADFVAQVVTTHRLEVAAAQLGDARSVWIRIASDPDPARLAIATARP
jgi:hypothetical protein